MGRIHPHHLAIRIYGFPFGELAGVGLAQLQDFLYPCSKDDR